MKNFLSLGLLFFILIPCYFHGDVSGIIGGRNTPASTYYAALVSSDGTITPITGFPPGGTKISSVAINSSGFAVIGGESPTAAYAALVSPSGNLTVLNNIPTSGLLYAVAISNNGTAVLGGSDYSNPMFAALVSSSGSVTPLTNLPVNGGEIYSVAINDSGNTIIGGYDFDDFAYAALVSPSGNVTPLADLPASGNIYGIAINNSASALVGGNVGSSPSVPYAAFVSSSGALTPIQNLPVQGILNSVSMNDSGNAIIGGSSGPNPTAAYAALVSSSGIVTPLTGLPSNGNIARVSINDSGNAIIGGANSTAPYAALVSSEGILTPLTGLNPSGNIQSVAMHSSGVALIGGLGGPYAAFVSPLGIATPLEGIPVSGSILSVAVVNESPLFDIVVPRAVDTGSDFAGTSFAFASQVSPTHSLGLRFADNTKQSQSQETSLVADANDRVYGKSPGNVSKSDYSVWIDGFGYYARQQEPPSPRITNTTGGVLVGLDYLKIQDIVLGIGMGYSRNAGRVDQNRGHSHSDQGVASLSFTVNKGRWFVNTTAWGGFYHVKNVRKSAPNIVATSSFNGWTFLPHFELGYFIPLKVEEDKRFDVEPFVMLDWVNNWQGHIREKGASGFNLIIGSLYTSLLRTEAGLRFIQDARFGWGHILFVEKGSYVNKKPFHAGPTSTAFIGSASSFSIEVFSNQMQNLGAVQGSIQFLPENPSYPYGSFAYQGEFGSLSFQSHLGVIELGKSF